MATATVNVTKRDLRRLYNQWRNGRSKYEIERTEFGVDTHRGKLVTRLFADRLGLDTRGV